MDWTQEAIERLRAFWRDGLSTAEIGRRMGISKNAVVGKAHRLNLATRPSPIHQLFMLRTAPPRSRSPSENTKKAPAQPPVTVRVGSQAHDWPLEPAELRIARLTREEEMPSLLRRIVGQPSHVNRNRPKNCCWLSGHEPPYGQCHEAVAPDSSYCPKHHALAHQKLRIKRQNP
jgi:GcrA cell cycle regulator